MTMERKAGEVLVRTLLAGALSLAMAGVAQAQTTSVDADRIEQLEAKVEAQDRQIESLRRSLAEQQRSIDALGSQSGEMQARQLDALRARGESFGQPSPLAPAFVAAGAAAPAAAAVDAMAGSSAPAAGAPGAAYAQAQGVPAGEGPMQVGQPPETQSRPPEIAQIFDQPGVLTPRGKFILEPSLQLGYSSNDRVALVGYTIIPAILIGLIDVRQVKTSSITAALAARYGVSNRFELELKVPYSWVNGDTVSREIFTGTAQDSVFNADGHGIGDIELTGRYQLPNAGPDHPYYVLWLRYKSRTGTDLFEVTTDCVTRCVANATGTGLPLELPTGSGFAAIQPGVTWLYASDPVVFFGSFSYLHNFKREDVSRTVLTGAPEGFPQTTTEFIGEVKAGDIIGFNVGVGLALNEKAAISLGYDQSLVGKTEQNGEDTPGAVNVVLGTLVLGGSYRFSDRASLNVALGVGVTRDTPDVSLNVRVPITF
jgi:uncharacterized coiled-coil protein SlyX